MTTIWGRGLSSFDNPLSHQNFNGVNTKVGASGTGTDIGPVLNDLYLFHITWLELDFIFCPGGGIYKKSEQYYFILSLY